MGKHLTAVLVLAIAGVLLLVLSRWRVEPRKVSGFIEADEIRVGSRVGGRVRAVPAEEGSRVAAGDLLVELDPFDLEERRAEAAALLAQRRAQHEEFAAGYRPEEIAQAKARVDQLRAVLERLENGPRPQEIEVAEAEVGRAQAELELATLNRDRAQRLFAADADPRERLDEATRQFTVAREALRARQANLALLKEGTRREDIEEARAGLEEAKAALSLLAAGYRREEVEAAKAAAEAARAGLEAIERQIEEIRVTAPASAVVDAVDLEPGDLVNAGAPVLSLVDRSHLWVRAYVPENHLDIRLGEEVKVSVDSFPDEAFRGRITFIASQAEFTPGNVQTPEERSKQVFRIKVDLLDGLDRLRPGMAADVWLGERGEAR
jgi:multidrug resistance efflux pump